MTNLKFQHATYTAYTSVLVPIIPCFYRIIIVITLLTFKLRDRMVAIVKEMKCGSGEDFTSFTSAVIDHNVSEIKIIDILIDT